MSGEREYEPPAVEQRESVTEPLIGVPYSPSPEWRRPSEGDDATR